MDRLHLLDLSLKQAITDIHKWVEKSTSPTQPTLIPNATGMRLPDKLTHKHFRRYHAECYPAKAGATQTKPAYADFRGNLL
jgi:predicted RNase H-like nuclease